MRDTVSALCVPGQAAKCRHRDSPAVRFPVTCIRTPSILCAGPYRNGELHFKPPGCFEVTRPAIIATPGIKKPLREIILASYLNRRTPACHLEDVRLRGIHSSA